MVRVGICEDEPVFREEARAMCREYFAGRPDKSMRAEIISFASALLVLKYKKPLDILLLDIEMEGINGIELKEMLEMQGKNTRIIYITNYEKYALRGYGMHVCGYLKKPLDQLTLKDILDKLCAALGESSYYYIEAKDGFLPIPFDSILYIESHDHFCTVRTEQQKYEHRKTISMIEEELIQYDFFRCHKSYIVNLKQIDQMNKDILMRNGDLVQVSRRKEIELKEKYIKFIQEEMNMADGSRGSFPSKDGR